MLVLNICHESYEVKLYLRQPGCGSRARLLLFNAFCTLLVMTQLYLVLREWYSLFDSWVLWSFFKSGSVNVIE